MDYKEVFLLWLIFY